MRYMTLSGLLVMHVSATLASGQNSKDCDQFLVKFRSYSPSPDQVWMCQSRTELAKIMDEYADCIRDKKDKGIPEYNVAISNLHVMEMCVRLLESFDKVNELSGKLSRTGDSLDGSDVKRVAEQLTGSYGEGPNQYVCTTFVATALRRAGFVVDKAILDVINIRLPAHLQSGDSLVKLVKNRDPRVKGVVTALVATRQGQEVDITTAAVGDIVQYWTLKGNTAVGHTGIVSKVHSDGAVDLLGSHRSRGGVGILAKVSLNKPGFTVFVVRPVVK